MKTSDFTYTLPSERIAQMPAEPRDSSRLVVIDRSTDGLEHKRFHDILDFLKPNDLLVVNQTRVINARLFVRKADSGGKAEILLLNQRDDCTWEAMVGGRRMTAGRRFVLENGMEGEIIEVLQQSRRLVRFDQSINTHLEQIGNAPLPPYITEYSGDPERYQTVYADAQKQGSSAAPTAGLHFTPSLIEKIKAKGVEWAEVTLHVGLDTFAPVHEEDPLDHQIHSEWCEISEKIVRKIQQTRAKDGRVIAVGTTSVRTLESAARDGELKPFSGPTDLFILPGYEFRVVDAMITNFHLPQSTLLMLVSAFYDRKKMLAVYQEAVEREYRFFSFGDAMFIQ